MNIRSTLGSQQQPHMPYGINEKGVRHDALRIPLRLNDATGGQPMRHDSFALVYLQPGQDVKFSPHALVACSAETCYTKLSQKSETALGVDAPYAASKQVSHGRTEMPDELSYHTPVTESQDASVEFPPRLIQRVDALAYSLPMVTPSGERCFVTLVGSYAAWGETMTALVRAGFDYAEPGRKLEPGAGNGGAK